MPRRPPIGQSIFYSIVRHITGCGKQQEARAGVDYIKVNFHTDNFSIIERIIDVITPLSDTLRNELRQLRSSVFTFLSYGYAVHARKGVKASSKEIAQHTHQVQDHEAERSHCTPKWRSWPHNPIFLMYQTHRRSLWIWYEDSSIAVHKQRDQK